jgi:hypothetical protein
MNLELSDEDARLLLQYLGYELQRLDTEVIHSDKREFRRALAADVAKLRAIHERLSQGVEEGSQRADLR